MVKKAFVSYINFVLLASLLSNFIKIFFPSADYIIGIALCISCFALSVFVFYFRTEESKKTYIMAVVLFVLSIVLLVLELISIDLPVLREYGAVGFNGTYEPHSDMLRPSNSMLILLYNFDIISRVVYIINSVIFIAYFGIKLTQQVRHKGTK